MMSMFLTVSYASLFGQTSITKVKYEGGISIFGRVAEADLTLEENLKEGTYKATLVAQSVGIVKALTSNRKDMFISEGKIVKGVYIPHKFVKKVTEDKEIKQSTYTFDYTKDEVLKEVYKEEIVENCSYDIISMNAIREEETLISQEKKYIELQRNDFLTLFLNMSADKLNEGSVSYIDQNKDDDVMLINKTMFQVSKENGDEIYRISFDKNNSMFFDKAVALDIAFYGDAYLKKISEERKTIN
jgi:hypothetical protein